MTARYTVLWVSGALLHPRLRSLEFMRDCEKRKQVRDKCIRSIQALMQITETLEERVEERIGEAEDVCAERII